MRAPFIETFTGRRFKPLDPWPDDIDIQDIAHALSNQCRFSGHVREFYSVAEHSVRVSWTCRPEDALWGLLHDASEAYLVDLPSPLKQNEGFSGYRASEKELMRVVCQRFGLNEVEPSSVRIADQILLSTEVRDLMFNRPEHWAGQLVQAPLSMRIQPWSAVDAKHKFLLRFNELTKGL